MWDIFTEVLKWCNGEYSDAEAKRRIFAAFERARAKHITPAPEPC